MNRLQDTDRPGIRSSIVPKAATHIKAQGGSKSKAPKRGAKPTVSAAPCLVLRGAMEDRNVRTSRTTRSQTRSLAFFELKSWGAWINAVPTSKVNPAMPTVSR